MYAQLQRLIPQSLAERMHLAEREMQGENRLVTALFADISGFTPLSQRLPTESVVEKVNQCFQAVTDAVYRYEGSVNRFIGDCVLAFFGAPLAHENDPERAIRAGLDMKAEVVKLSLNLSVGINTGVMYFGPIGTQRHLEVSAYGPDINLAKRLQETAKPGQVIIGESTYRLTRRAFEFQPLSPLTLKGIAKPVPAYEAVKVSPRPEKIRGIEGLRAPMIGREEEFAKLKGCLEDLMNGRGQIASIIGVAGVGKSRLVSELRAHLERMEGKEGREEGKEVEQAASLLGKQMEGKEGREEGKERKGTQQSAIHNLQSAIWLEGRCLSIGESVGYWVFIDILKSYFQFDATDDERGMAEKIVAAVKELLPQQADEILPLFGNLLSIKFGNELDERLKFAGPEQIKHQTFMALRDFFFALAQRQPLVLVFEDLHWADNLSLDLILLLMEMLTLAPMMLICVYRPEQEHKSWRIGSIAPSKCLERYTEIHLRELRPQESRRMVEELLTIENLPEGGKNLILTKSEGNPFFVEEVIRSLIDSGAVYREGNVWVAKAEIESFAVPDTIQGVIMSRIDRLEEEVKYVLQCASVIGRLFRHRLLAYTSGRERELDQHLWRLEDRDLVYEERAVPELEYSFKHVLTQETAYQSLLARRRAAFHRKVAEGIEALYRERLEEFYEELAYHYDESGDVEKTVEYLLKAGEKARRAYRNDEAIRCFQRTFELLDASPTLGEERKDWRLEALKGLGQAYIGVGKNSEAEERFRQAIALGQEMGLSARELVRLYWWLGEVLWWYGRYDDKIGEEGLALLGDDIGSVEAALMNQRIAGGYRMTGNRDKHREFMYRTVQFIERLPYSEELRSAYNSIVIMYADDKNLDEAMKWLKSLEQKAIQHHDLRGLGDVLNSTGFFILSPSGDLRGAISQYQISLELMTKIGDDKHRSRSLDWMAQTFLSLGDLQKTEAYAYRAHEIAESIIHRLVIAQSYMTIGTISLCQEPTLNEVKGLWEKAIDAFQKAAQLFRETVAPPREARATLYSGRVYWVQGKREEALRQFQEAIALAGPSADALSGLEEAYDAPQAFRAFCQKFREEHPDAGDSPLVQWYLEPTKPHDFPQNPLSEAFAESFSPDWGWHDPFNDCSFTVGNGLEIRAANGRDLWHINLSAPRLLRPVSGDFAAQTVCVPALDDRPAIGGILLWKDQQNYLRIDQGTRGRYEINFSGCIDNKDLIIGRGRLHPAGMDSTGEPPVPRVFLRLERNGSRVNALCSADGAEWFTVGGVDFPVEAPVEVGLHAIGNIDRTIYHGAFPEGTAIRFEAFELWAK